MKNVNIIRAHLNKDEMLAQLAEEAAELAQAALKLRRACADGNPTPVGARLAFENLVEEMADVSVCIHVLDFDDHDTADRCKRIMRRKLERWAARLEGNT